MIPLFPRSAAAACGLFAADRGKRELLVGAGYPGRQSLRSFALGYFLLAPCGAAEVRAGKIPCRSTSRAGAP